MLAAAPACSDSGSSPSGDGPSFAGLLQAVPDTAATRGSPVYYGNLRVLRNGEQATSFEDDLRLLFQRSGGAVFVPESFRMGPNEPEFSEYLGFDTRQIEAGLEFACEVLRPGGAYVAKVLAGGADNELVAELKRNFATVKHAKPPASRKDSSEWYVVAQGFKGLAAT